MPQITSETGKQEGRQSHIPHCSRKTNSSPPWPWKNEPRSLLPGRQTGRGVKNDKLKGRRKHGVARPGSRERQESRRVGNYRFLRIAAEKRTRVHRHSGIGTSTDPSSLGDRQGEASKMINRKGDASTGWLAPDHERDRDAGG